MATTKKVMGAEAHAVRAPVRPRSSSRRRLRRLASQLGAASAASATGPPLYLASVPVFVHYLGQLREILSRVGGRSQLLSATLAPDMLAAGTQCHVCANYCLRIAFPLAGKPVPPSDTYRLPELSDFSSTDVSDIEARIDAVVTALESLAPGEFEGAEARQITHTAGPAELTQS
jgi:hypothetical protein